MSGPDSDSLSPAGEVGPSLVLGIDGGGTKTVAWLGRCDPVPAGNVETKSQGILGRGTAGPSNQRAIGPELALRHLDEAVALAFVDAGISRCRVRAACVGLAGADRVSDRTVIEQWASRSELADYVRVVNDAIPLLYAGTSPEASDASTIELIPGVGIALICGTGSMAYGVNAAGETGRCGGWGYLIGDEGSAYRIGQAALHAISLAVDGRGPQTRLTDEVTQFLQVAQPADLVGAVYGASSPRSVVAELARTVFAAASNGDPVAAEILRQGAAELARLVSVLADRLRLTQNLALFLTGSVLLEQDAYRRDVLRNLTASGIHVAAIMPVQDAVLGAVRLARLAAVNTRDSSPRPASGKNH